MTTDDITLLKLTASKLTGCYDFERLNESRTKMIKDGTRVLNRQIIMYYLKQTTLMSLTEIGEIFTIPVNHATVMHSVKTVQNYIETDKKISALVDEFFRDAIQLNSPVQEEAECIAMINSFFLIQ